MLSEKQIIEIREHLQNAKNPIFFFDNDADGLTSFIMLQKYIGAGRGVSLKGLPSLQKSFFKKVEEFNADYVFCLDRPSVDADFMQLAEEKGIPVVCIDHHQYEGHVIKNYYNTYHSSGNIEPVSYLCYKIIGKKEDMWLAVAGSIGDCFIPEFLDDFKKQYPELLNYNYKSAYDIIYKTDLGKVISIINFAIKDSVSNYVSFIKFLIKAKGPYDLLEENSKTRVFLKRYEYIGDCIKKIVKDAEEHIDKKNKLLFHTYGGKMSLSQHASDELNYKHPELAIVLGYTNGSRTKFSIRGQINVRKLALSSIKNIQDSTGGGHEHSCGIQINTSDVPKFKENLIREMKEMKG